MAIVKAGSKITPVYVCLNKDRSFDAQMANNNLYGKSQ